MNIFKPALTKIDYKETLRYAQMKESAEFPNALVKDAIKEVLLYASPNAVWETYAYENNIVKADVDYEVISKGLIRHLNSSDKVAFLSVTIGEAVEERIDALFKESAYAKAVLMDAAATQAVEEVSDNVCLYIENTALKQGYVLTRRFSPGYGDWHLTEQPKVLALTKGAEIGVSLTKSLMLMPRKSITAVVGFSLGNAINKAKDCAYCEKTDCEFRRKNNA